MHFSWTYVYLFPPLYQECFRKRVERLRNQAPKTSNRPLPPPQIEQRARQIWVSPILFWKLRKNLSVFNSRLDDMAADSARHLAEMLAPKVLWFCPVNRHRMSDNLSDTLDIEWECLIDRTSFYCASSHCLFDLSMFQIMKKVCWPMEKALVGLEAYFPNRSFYHNCYKVRTPGHFKIAYHVVFLYS